MTTPPGKDGYPQAVADDYPGWGVKHEDSQWVAWCPAVTVHATSAAALRAAIEQAITGEDQPGGRVGLGSRSGA